VLASRMDASNGVFLVSTPEQLLGTALTIQGTLSATRTRSLCQTSLHVW
jgi:hypothetical protein